MSQEPNKPVPIAIGIGPGGESPQRSTSDAEWRVADMEADSDGVIWGIAMSIPLKEGSYISADSIKKLAIFDEKSASWHQHEMEATRDGTALRLGRLSDGSVACLWRSGQRSIVTKHRNGKSSPWAVMDGVFNQPRLCAGLKGELFITETGPKIASIPADGDKPSFHTIPDEFLTPPEKPEESSRSYSAMHAVHAGDGSLWLWCYALQPQKHLWRISGFIRLESGHLAAVKGLPFKPGSNLSAVIADGKEHLFVAETGHSLWRLGIKPVTAQQIKIPDDVFAYIEQLTFIASHLHVITCPQPDEIEVTMSTTVKNHLELRTTRHYDTTRPTGKVYRIQGRELRAVVSGIDDQPGFGRTPRSMVEVSEGIMIGSNSGGPTWLATSGTKPRRLGRESGFALRDAAEVLPLPKQRWLVRSFDTTWSVISLAPKSTTGGARMTVVKTIMPMVQDADANLWAWRQGDGGFAKWSKGSWSGQEPPPVSGNACLNLATDQHGQAWLISTRAGASAVLDFTTGKWTRFDSPEQAVDKKLIPGDTVRIPRYLVFGLVSHSRGAKGFLDWAGTVHVLQRQGGQWTRSKLTDIAGPKAAASGVPYFDNEGQFCIPVEHRHYRLRADGQWEHIQNAKTDNDRTYDWQESQPPKDSTVPNVTSTAYDRHGIAWMTQRDGSLWKWLAGAAMKLTSSDGLPMLPPQTQIQQVLVDAQGNAILKQAGGTETIIYHSLPALPCAKLAGASTEKTSEGVPILIFSAIQRGWHRYRIHDMPWSPLTQQPRVLLHTLTPGNHRIEVQTFDAELTPVGAIQEMWIRRKALAADAIAALIADLNSDSLEKREQASAALRIQGKLAEPRLRQALQEADPDTSQHWWITAVLQAIERVR